MVALKQQTQGHVCFVLFNKQTSVHHCIHHCTSMKRESGDHKTRNNRTDAINLGYKITTGNEQRTGNMNKDYKNCRGGGAF